MKKVLVTGSEGMLGKALMRSLSNRQFAVEGTDIRDKSNPIDITKVNDVADLMDGIKPDILIHTAAWTDVDGCELNPDKAYLVNAEGTKNVAEACKRTDAFLVYMSTDYVFDGTKTRPYTEEDRPDPINIYGRSKSKGEDFIKEILDNYLIIRSSWLFGKGGKNFVDTIIAKAGTEKKLEVVDDQRGSPTYTVDLAEAIAELLATCNLQPATLNITNSDSCTWYEFAKEIIRVKGIKEVVLEPITSEQINRPARRPKMCILDNSRFKKIYKRQLPGWQDALQRYLKK